MDIIEVLQTYIREAGTQKKAAQKLGVSTALVWDLLHSRRSVSANIAAKLGYKRIVTYQRIENEHNRVME